MPRKRNLRAKNQTRQSVAHRSFHVAREATNASFAREEIAKRLKVKPEVLGAMAGLILIDSHVAKRILDTYGPRKGTEKVAELEERLSDPYVFVPGRAEYFPLRGINGGIRHMTRLRPNPTTEPKVLEDAVTAHEIFGDGIFRAILGIHLAACTSQGQAETLAARYNANPPEIGITLSGAQRNLIL